MLGRQVRNAFQGAEAKISQRQEAVRTLLDFLELDPGDMEVLGRLEHWLRELGRHADADRVRQRLKALEPELPSVEEASGAGGRGV